MKVNAAASILLLSLNPWQHAWGQGSYSREHLSMNADPDEEVTLIVQYKNLKGKLSAVGHASDEAHVHNLRHSNLSIITAKRREMEELKNDPNIESVEENQLYYANSTTIPASRRLEESVPYGIEMVEALDVPLGNAPMKICVIDTGYDEGHIDLPTTATHGVTGFVPDESGYNGQTWNSDGHGHGTHCAGTIGAIGGNDVGVVGVNKDPSKFTFRIGKGLTDQGSGTTSGVIAAVDDCIDQGSQVISMSLGGGGYSQAFLTSLKSGYEQGVLIVAAAGNGGDSGYSYPASYPYALSVAAVDSNGSRASFSQINDQVEISGPGVAVESTLPNDTYDAWSGTSMACPHVAGVAALVWSNFPSCTNNQIRNVLLKTAEGTGCDDLLGYGIVKAKQAYDMLALEGCDAGGSEVIDVDLVKGGCNQLPCESDADCDNGIYCDGMETCNSNGECVPGSPPCSEDEVCGEGINQEICCSPTASNLFTVNVKTDFYPSETSWEVLNEGGKAVFSDNGYDTANTEYNDMTCLMQGDYKFTIRDGYGDGVCCDVGEGFYKLWLGDNEIKSGGDFGLIEEYEFQVVDAPTSPPGPTPTSSPISSPTPTPISDQEFCVALELYTDEHGEETSWVLEDNGVTLNEGSSYASKQFHLIDVGCYLAKSTDYNRFKFTINDDEEDGICCNFGKGYYNLKINGIVVKEGGMFDKSESFSFPVNESKKIFKLELQNDNWGDEISWELLTTDGKIEHGQGYDSSALVVKEFELIADACHDFTILDSYGDGILHGYYKLFWDDHEIYNSNPDYTDVTKDTPNLGGMFKSHFRAIGDGCTEDRLVSDEGIDIRKYSGGNPPVNPPTSLPPQQPPVTPEPTNPPTGSPTDSSTDTPTDFPTDVHTDTPTDFPTAAHTDTPTDFPTDAHTDTPSDFPTATHTDTPTDLPTDAHTETPTFAPIMNTPFDQVCVELELQTDSYGGETSWKLEDHEGTIIASENGFSNNEFHDIDIGCYNLLSTDSNQYTFTIKDADGICCSYGNGWYNLKVDGIVVKEGGKFDGSESFSFPVDESKKIFKLELQNDYWGDEISWELQTTDGKIEHGQGYDSSALIVKEFELIADACHDFTILDSYGDGILYGYYKLFWDDHEIYNSNPDYDEKDSDVPNKEGIFKRHVRAIGDGCTESLLLSEEKVNVRKPHASK